MKLSSLVFGVGRITKNGLIASQVVARLIVDDPVLLALNVSRRLPHRLAQRTATVLKHLPGEGTGALAAQMAGEPFPAGAQMMLDGAAPPKPSSWGIVGGAWASLQQRLVAEVAISYSLVDANNTDLPAMTRARTAWDLGRVSLAVELARKVSKSYASRLAGELAVLEPGWVPRVQKVEKNTPGQGKSSGSDSQTIHAVHLITNSLPATQSGYTLRTHRLLDALSKEGVKISAFTRLGYPVTIGNLAARSQAVVDSITYRRVLPKKFGSTAQERLENWVQSISNSLFKEQPAPHIFHTTTNYPNAVAAQALAQAYGTPWVYEVRGVMEETWVASKKTAAARAQAQTSQRFELIRARETELMQRANHVLTLSETMKELMVARGISPQKITVIPNAVSPELFEQDLSPEQARSQLGLPTQGFWVGSVSSVVAYEGFDTLLDAVALLRAQGLDVRFLLAGDGVARAGLEQQARALGLGEHAVFLGRIAPQQAIIAHQALDTFVVPRTKDRVCASVTPLKPIEAMALGRPVVLSDIAPLAELANNAVSAPAGKLATAEDPLSCAVQIRELMENPAERAQLVERARLFARTRTWAHNAQLVRDIYEQLLEEEDEAQRDA